MPDGTEDDPSVVVLDDSVDETGEAVEVVGAAEEVEIDCEPSVVEDSVWELGVPNPRNTLTSCTTSFSGFAPGALVRMSSPLSPMYVTVNPGDSVSDGATVVVEDAAVD